tara:strand:- start:11961 stop:12995 length:1035 start_codon:yes stop_codon:yes gene_type:complete
MAIDANAYSPKQFTFLIAEQDDFGTFNLESTGGGTRDANNWVALDVDSIGSPSLNLNQGIEPRTGSRILQATDFFQDNKAKVIEMSVSGTATTEVLDMLIPNITQSADTSSPYGIASNIGSQTFVAATDDQQDMQIFSIAYNSPSSGNTLGFKDCFCTSLSLSGDSGTEGGRVKFSATFKTGTLPEDLTDGLLTVDTAITSNNYFMSSWDADDRIVAGIANCLVNSFNLNIENDMVFSGISSTGYESAARVGEISATADFSVKYDANTDVLFENFHDQAAGASEGATLMAHQASLADGSFGFKFASSVITSVAFNEGDMMMLDVSVKAVGAGTGESTVLFEVAC